MLAKKQLLKNLITKYCTQERAIADGFPLAYQENLVEFLYEKLRLTFLHIHDTSEIQSHLNEILPLVVPVITANKHKRGFFKFDDAKQQAIMEAITARLNIINTRNEQKLIWIGEWNKAFFHLKQQNYLLFLRETERLLNELSLIKTRADVLTTLIDIFQSLVLSKQDKQDLQALIAGLCGDGPFEQLELAGYLSGLSNVKVAFDAALKLQEAVVEKQINIQNTATENKAEVIVEQYKIKSIKDLLYSQKFHYSVAQIFIADLLRFINDSDIKKAIELNNLRKKLRSFCEAHHFFGISFSNYEFVKDYVLKNIPAAGKGFFELEWRYLFAKITEESFKFIEHNLNKSVLNKVPVPLPASVSVERLMIDAGGTNSVYPAVVKMSDGTSRQKLVYRISRHELMEGDPEVLRNIYSIPHPTIIKRYYTALYAFPQEELWGSVDYIEHALRGEITDYPLILAEMPKLFYAIIDGVKFLHGLNIAHLDLKPKNILLGDDGIPRIIDFDLARYNNNKVERLAGSAAYWPPEVFSTIDHKKLNYLAIDAWALGITLYELYTGSQPPCNNEKEFAGFEQNELLHPFFHKDADGNFLNPEAAPVAEVIRQLLDTDPEKRLDNFIKIARLPYFARIDREVVYKELAQNDYLVTMQAEFKQEIATKLYEKKQKTKSLTAIELTLSEKVSCYQNIINQHEGINIELTVADEQLMQEHIHKLIRSNPTIAVKKDFSAIQEKVQLKQRNKVLSYKKLKQERALDALKEELVQLQKIEAEKIIREKLKNLPQYAEFICERMGMANILLTDNSLLKSIRKQLKKELLDLKNERKANLKNQDWQQLSLIIEKYNQILHDKTEKSAIKKLLTARELLNQILSLSDFQTNETLKGLFLRINEEIKQLNKDNPLIMAELQQADLSPKSYHQREIIILAAAVSPQLLKSTLPTSEEWQKMTTRYYKVVSFLAKRRLKSLKHIDKLIKLFNKTVKLEDRIDVALKLIVVCQQWLADDHNIAKRNTVLQLQTTTLAELNWLLGQAISLNINLNKSAFDIQPAKYNEEAKIENAGAKISNRYLAKLFAWKSTAKNTTKALGLKITQTQLPQEETSARTRVNYKR